MKIALITPRYPPTFAGGGEISARLLAEQLQEHGVAEVVVYSFDGKSDEEVNSVSVHRLANVPKYPYTLPNEIAYRKLRSADLDADLLHAYNMYVHPAVGRLSASTRTPAVATLNAYPLINWKNVNVTPSLKRQLYELTVLRMERPRLQAQMRNIELFLPLSDAVETIYRKNGFEESEFEVIPNMVDPEFKIPKRSVEDADSIQLLYVGYLRDSKGVRHLIDAMQVLPAEFKLRVVGGGPELDSLRHRANDGSASDRIEFTGSVAYEEVTGAYADADVFVHPGVWPEPFGRTILEAMQAGLPVVTTDIGGPSETVPQPELRCEPADPQALSESVQYASEHHERIGTRNAAFVDDIYHPGSVIPEFQAAYERVLRTTATS